MSGFKKNTIFSKHFFLKNLSNIKFISGPVFKNGNHWCLIYIYLLTNDIYYIDPNGAHEDEAKNVENNMRKYLNNTQLKLASINHQKQQDSYNCGVFVCHFFKLLIENKIDSFSTQIDIDNYRETIKATIASNSKITVCCICHKPTTGFSAFFMPKLKLSCKHKFHTKCSNNQKCIICN